MKIPSEPIAKAMFVVERMKFRKQSKESIQNDFLNRLISRTLKDMRKNKATKQ